MDYADATQRRAVVESVRVPALDGGDAVPGLRIEESPGADHVGKAIQRRTPHGPLSNFTPQEFAETRLAMEKQSVSLSADSSRNSG
jgi:hypothetical protein